MQDESQKEEVKKEIKEEVKEENQETGQTLEEGHRVLANYNGAEVRGEVKRIIEDKAGTEVILLLDNGKKAVIDSNDLISIIVSSRAK